MLSDFHHYLFRVAENGCNKYAWKWGHHATYTVQILSTVDSIELREMNDKCSVSETRTKMR